MPVKKEYYFNLSDKGKKTYYVRGRDGNATRISEDDYNVKTNARHKSNKSNDKPTYWAISANDSNGTRKTAYFSHVRGREYKLAAADFFDNGSSDNVETFRKMAKVIQKHNGKIVPNKNATIGSSFPISSVNEKYQYLLKPHLKMPTVYAAVIKVSPSQTIATKSGTMRDCKLEVAGKETLEGYDPNNSVYKACLNGTDCDYALTTVEETEDKFKNRQDIYSKGGSASITTMCKESWYCADKKIGNYLSKLNGYKPLMETYSNDAQKKAVYTKLGELSQRAIDKKLYLGQGVTYNSFVVKYADGKTDGNVTDVRLWDISFVTNFTKQPSPAGVTLVPSTSPADEASILKVHVDIIESIRNKYK